MTLRATHGILALLVAASLAGCGGGAGTTKSKDVDTGEMHTGAKPSDPGAHLLEPGSATWSYAVLPDPAPSKSPKSRLNEVTFDLNSAALQGEASAVAREVGKHLLANPNQRVLCLGFAHKSEKVTMGMARANALKDALIRGGVPIGRIETATFGNQFSKADNAEPTMMKLERRCEIWVLAE